MPACCKDTSYRGVRMLNSFPDFPNRECTLSLKNLGMAFGVITSELQLRIKR
jgi:hypothetical protein